MEIMTMVFCWITMATFIRAEPLLPAPPRMPERHIRPKAKPPDSPIPDRFFADNLNVNPYQYDYTLSSENLCRSERVHLLVLVRSAPSHSDRRQAIRETWGSTSDLSKTVLVAFLLGRPDSTGEQNRLEEESLLHDDIIQENYKDSYKNLTFKDVSAFKFASLFCRHADYVMVASDEVLIDMDKLLTFLDSKQEDEEMKFVLCHLYPCCTRVYRTHPKYDVAEKEYESRAYPAYCSGTVYVARPHLIEQLYYMSIDTPSFMPDDAWIGVMAEKLGAKFHDTYTAFTGVRNQPTVLNDIYAKNYPETETMIAVLDYDFPGREAIMMRRLWVSILKHQERKRLEQKELEDQKQRFVLISIVIFMTGLLFVCHRLCDRPSVKRRFSKFIRWRP